MNVLDFLILASDRGHLWAVAQAIAGFSRGGLLVAIAVGFHRCVSWASGSNDSPGYRKS